MAGFLNLGHERHVRRWQTTEELNPFGKLMSRFIIVNGFGVPKTISIAVVSRANQQTQTWRAFLNLVCISVTVPTTMSVADRGTKSFRNLVPHFVIERVFGAPRHISVVSRARV